MEEKDEGWGERGGVGVQDGGWGEDAGWALGVEGRSGRERRERKPSEGGLLGAPLWAPLSCVTLGACGEDGVTVPSLSQSWVSCPTGLVRPP